MLLRAPKSYPDRSYRFLGTAASWACYSGSRNTDIGVELVVYAPGHLQGYCFTYGSVGIQAGLWHPKLLFYPVGVSNNTTGKIGTAARDIGNCAGDSSSGTAFGCRDSKLPLF